MTGPRPAPRDWRQLNPFHAFAVAYLACVVLALAMAPVVWAVCRYVLP